MEDCWPRVRHLVLATSAARMPSKAKRGVLSGPSTRPLGAVLLFLHPQGCEPQKPGKCLRQGILVFSDLFAAPLRAIHTVMNKVSELLAGTGLAAPIQMRGEPVVSSLRQSLDQELHDLMPLSFGDHANPLCLAADVPPDYRSSFSLLFVNRSVNDDSKGCEGCVSLLASAFLSFPEEPGYNFGADLQRNGEVGPSGSSDLASSFLLVGD